MSMWTYIKGVIEVWPMGRTQAEKTYILETILEHLPKVTGSEKDMNVYSFPKKGYNSSSNCDEFGNFSNTMPISWTGGRSKRTQDNYIIVVEASLRDRDFKRTYKEFINWLCRLSKRVDVVDILVRVYDDYGKHYIINGADGWADMCEYPSWSEQSNGEPAWCEYLMWKPMDGEMYPAILAYKYFSDEENDKRVENWIK